MSTMLQTPARSDEIWKVTDGCEELMRSTSVLRKKIAALFRCTLIWSRLYTIIWRGQSPGPARAYELYLATIYSNFESSTLVLLNNSPRPSDTSCRDFEA